jgi:hypothetical protein
MNDKEETFDSLKAALDALKERFGRYSSWWSYCDASGQPIGAVVRWARSNASQDGGEGKTIRQVSRTADGRWRIGATPEPRFFPS